MSVQGLEFIECISLRLRFLNFLIIILRFDLMMSKRFLWIFSSMLPMFFISFLESFFSYLVILRLILLSDDIFIIIITFSLRLRSLTLLTVFFVISFSIPITIPWVIIKVISLLIISFFLDPFLRVGEGLSNFVLVQLFLSLSIDFIFSVEFSIVSSHRCISFLVQSSFNHFFSSLGNNMR